MKMNLEQAFDMIERGETPEQYKKRINALRKYCTERDFLIDEIEILTKPEDQEKAKAKRIRLKKVEQRIAELR